MRVNPRTSDQIRSAGSEISTRANPQRGPLGLSLVFVRKDTMCRITSNFVLRKILSQQKDCPLETVMTVDLLFDQCIGILYVLRLSVRLTGQKSE